MSSKISGKFGFRRSSKKSKKAESIERPKEDAKSEVFEKALGELMEMTDDELMDSLSTITSDSDASETDGSDSPELPQEGEEVDEKPDAKSSEGSDSKLIEDPTVLFLIKSGIVNINQVSDALQQKQDGEELWRCVASLDGVDNDAVFAAVAKAAGIPAFTYLDAAPTRELMEELVDMFSQEKIARLLQRGLLPVDLDPDVDDSSPALVLATHDPTDSRIADVLAENELSGSGRFAPRPQLTYRINEVAAWVNIDPPFEMDEKQVESSESQTADSKVVDNQTDSSAESSSEESDSRTPENRTVADEQEDSNFNSDSELPTSDMEYQFEGDGIPSAEEYAEDSGSDESDSVQTYNEHDELSSMSSPASRDRVIRALLRSGMVSESQVQIAIREWQSSGGREALWRILADLNGVPKEAVYEEAARVYAFKQEQIEDGRPDYDFVVLTMDTVAENQREELLDLNLLPFEHAIDYETGAGRMVFVTPDPTLPEVSRLLHELDLGRFELRYAPESQIARLLDQLFPRKNEYLEKIQTEETAFDYGTSFEETVEFVDEEALDAAINRSKLINLFEATLVEATRMGASDIHIYPNPNRQVEIHFRLDGRLKLWHKEEGVAPEAFLSVVKDNSTNVDRFERDSAQDGFIQRKIDDALIRYRVSILPIATANQEIRAESIVIRILDDRKVLTELTQLGMLDVALERFDRAIRQPHGMVILTGPTGSGKSTTLVAALHQVVTPEVNVLTVEDPVEYIINGVRQIKLSHKLSLEGALRSILRHDPDIVMVGEMRDRHTAELAIKLANTGHLTFSTLHTNDAPAAVSRLYKMGVEPFLIAYAINLVVAQRLIRVVCPSCRQEDTEPDKVLMKSLGWEAKEMAKHKIYKAAQGGNCSTCNGMGYKGRRAICETLYFSDEIRHIIAESGVEIDEEAIREAGIKEGMLTLMQSAKQLVEMGETTLDEMLRVTGAE